MLDLDLNNFKFSRQKLDRALNKILSSLKNKIQPIVIWSGNGYHVLVPIEPLQFTLEDMEEFSKFQDPSKSILRFLEKYLSKGKSDSVHNSTVSFSNCMLRVPGSINSKHNNNDNQVSIIRKWNSQRFFINLLLGDFIAYLLDESDKQKKSYTKYQYQYRNKHNYNDGTLLSKV
jgi:hypothetical protein